MRPNSTTRKREVATCLVITGPAALSVHRGRLRVEHGFGCLDTRHTEEFDPPLRLKRIVRIGQGGTWSDNALRVLAENGCALYSVSQTGDVGYYLLPPDGPIKPALLRAQALLPHTDLGLGLAKRLVVAKVKGHEKTLSWMARQAVLPGLEEYAHTERMSLSAIQAAGDIDGLRLAEAVAADIYFDAWRGVPISFQKPGSGCVDVPARWREWRSRQSLRTGTNRDATDPLNALLNFGYAIAAAETPVACRAGSLEPTLAVIHADRDGRASFIYDLMEPLRPIVDGMMLEMVAERSFRINRDFILLGQGVCRLGVQLAAEVGKRISERLRVEAEKIVTEVRGLLQAAAPKALVVETRDRPESPELQALREAVSQQRTLTAIREGGACQRCGEPVARRRKLCGVCLPIVRKERTTEENRKRWEAWKEAGIDPTHGGEASRKRGEAIARSNRLKPRKGGQSSRPE
jgi:CRISPR-associated protein Cas1